MKYLLRSLAISLSLIVSSWAAVSASAHHSSFMYDMNKTVTIKGVVKEFQYTNPHSWLILETKKPDGTLEAWGFEAEGPSTLMRAGIRKSTIKPGMTLTITGHPMKDGRPAAAWISATTEDGTVLNPRKGFIAK